MFRCCLICSYALLAARNFSAGCPKQRFVFFFRSSRCLTEYCIFCYSGPPAILAAGDYEKEIVTNI